MIWYYLSGYYDATNEFEVTRVYDIYGNIITGLIYGSKYFQYRSFQWESKYRYSGLLYDKLKHLLSYSYRNNNHYRNHTMNYLHCYVYRMYRTNNYFVYNELRAAYSTTNHLGKPIYINTFLEVRYNYR